MLETKDVVKSTEEVLGHRFVLGEKATAKGGYDKEGNPTGETAKFLFRVKCLDVCQTVDVGIKDPHLDPKAFPVGSELAFDNLRVGPYATRDSKVGWSAIADAVRVVKPAAAQA
jgi:hypothetical protein